MRDQEQGFDQNRTKLRVWLTFPALGIMLTASLNMWGTVARAVLSESYYIGGAGGELDDGW